MPGVVIIEKRCKSCELCVNFCKRGCLAISGDMNAKGFFVARLVDPENCNGCGLCGEMCPDRAIEVWK